MNNIQVGQTKYPAYRGKAQHNFIFQLILNKLDICNENEYHS